jgi:hypothetical protein
MGKGLRAALAVLAASAAAAPAAHGARAVNEAYRVTLTGDVIRELAAAGYDMTETRRGQTVQIFDTPGDIARLKQRIDGLQAERLTNYSAEAKSAAPLASDPTAGADDSAYDVWAKYDAVDGDDKEQYTELYDRITAPDSPFVAKGIVAKRVVGQTYNGRDFIAIQVTKGATGDNIAGRPAVIYNAMQHAREWLAGETCKRQLLYTLKHYGTSTAAGREITRIVDNTELWFMCVSNPDGYEYTFTPGNRLWRKNLRDNNGDGVIAAGDGVDPNRNFARNWGRDDEGSSPRPDSETYRGPSAASEPETQAMVELMELTDAVFQKNDHTAAALLLYPQGFQQDTPTADDPIFKALAGEDVTRPGIPGFVPELSAGLYITNGDLTDFGYTDEGILGFTPEGTPASDPSVSGFEYADSETAIEQEFRRHLEFFLDLAKSAGDPDDPHSHLEIDTPDIVVSPFKVSYGDPQPVQANLKRALGAATLHFRVNGGAEQTRHTVEYTGGERHYRNDAVYYHRVRGFVTGTSPGDSVEVWFTAGDSASKHFTYTAEKETGNGVLLLANEDWSGKQPNPAPLDGPQRMAAYTAALDALGIGYDVYDVDAHGRTAPDPLGVLAHYSHVVWYTGDDYVTREPDAPGGSGMSKIAVDTQNNVRDFINDGGRLFFTGQNAGAEFADGYKYNPLQYENGEYCVDNPDCITSQDDFLQYWLGAYRYVTQDDATMPIAGEGPFAGLGFSLGGPDATEVQGLATLLVTSSILRPTAEYPYANFQDSARAAAYQRPGASPFEPFTGDWFRSAGTDDAAYKRLTKSFDLPAGDSTLKFNVSFDTEPDYDYFFVEIHTAGQDDWTTLADANGHTSDDVGLSCPTTGDGSNWQGDHPFLAHYQTIVDNGEDCDPTGTSGSWNAATGNSGGWQAWELPIPAAYAGKTVEISLTSASDPAVQGLGAWVDDVVVQDGGGSPIQSPDPSFESGDGGWVASGPPAGTENQATGWDRAQSAPFVEGPVTTTPDTVYTGFAFDSIDTAEHRQAFLQDVFGHLGAPARRTFDVPAEPAPSDGGSGGDDDGGSGGGGSGSPSTGGSGTGSSGAPAPAATPALRSVSTPRRARLRALLRRGLPVRVTCATPCRTTIALRKGSARIGRRVAVLPAGRSTVTVRLSRSAARRLARLPRRVRSFTVVTVVRVAGSPTRRVAVTIRR